MNQGVSLATDRVLGALWLAIIVLLLMTRELYRTVASPGITPAWRWIGILSIFLIFVLAILAVVRLTTDDRSPVGLTLAALLVVYSPIHAGLVLGLVGDGSQTFTFTSTVQAVIYPVLTLLSLFVLLTGGRQAELPIETPD